MGEALAQFPPSALLLGRAAHGFEHGRKIDIDREGDVDVDPRQGLERNDCVLSQRRGGRRLDPAGNAPRTGRGRRLGVAFCHGWLAHLRQPLSLIHDRFELLRQPAQAFDSARENLKRCRPLGQLMAHQQPPSRQTLSFLEQRQRL